MLIVVKQKTANEMRISDWSSDVCSSDLVSTSAFRSAGQRCSARRLLLIQADVAPGMIEMLKGAMDLLTVGDPGDPATDVGPVIDRAAYDKLMSYRDAVHDKWLKTVPVPEEGLFVPPTLIEIDAIEELKQEWFGQIGRASCRERVCQYV